MNFLSSCLERAKGGDAAAVTELLLMYRPLLLKEAIPGQQFGRGSVSGALLGISTVYREIQGSDPAWSGKLIPASGTVL